MYECHGHTLTQRLLRSSAKKDAEGWETVQRGRTAKPRSAAMVAKVSPVVASTPPKQDSAKREQPQQPQPPEVQPVRAQPPPDVTDQPKTEEQKVPAELDPVEQDARPEDGHMMEVLRSSHLVTSLALLCSPPPPLLLLRYQLFRSGRVILDRWINHICFCLGLHGIHRQTVQTGISTLRRLIVH